MTGAAGAAGGADGGVSDAATDKGASEAGTEAAAGGPLKLTSTAFMEGGTIPTDFTCVGGQGSRPSPPLAWTAGPATTKGYAIVLKDTDNGFTHWALWDIPPATLALAMGVPQNTHNLTDPAGAKQVGGNNESMGYIRPCPPNGTHTYVFTLYAQSELPLTNVQTTQFAPAITTQLEQKNVGKTTLSAKVTR
jgi:Raf kinase inhibitor-like YbhB/YbcL family protein